MTHNSKRKNKKTNNALRHNKEPALGPNGLIMLKQTKHDFDSLEQDVSMLPARIQHKLRRG